MKLSSALFLSAAFGSAASKTIKLPNLPDGSYVINIGEDGKPTWTDITAKVSGSPPLDHPKRNEASTNSRLRKRVNWPPGTHTRCPGGEWFLQDDLYKHGWDAFYATCAVNGGRKYASGTVLANYQGTSVTYMCSYTPNPCQVEEWNDAANWAARDCQNRVGGLMEPAYVQIPKWNKRYGYAKAGSVIC